MGTEVVVVANAVSEAVSIGWLQRDVISQRAFLLYHFKALIVKGSEKD
jgi:hypothetical protein